MTAEHLIATIWRRKLVFLLTLLLCLAATVAVTLSLPERYSATVTIFVGERSVDGDSLLIDTAAGEQLARTYTTLAANPNVADTVRLRLTEFQTPDDLLERMSFAPVERTQLLEITARASRPERARTIANVYGGTFVNLITGQFNRGVVPSRIALSQPAALPTSPSSPNVPLYLGIGGLLCVVLAGAAALLRDRLDDRLSVNLDTEAVLGHPVLLRLPNLSRLDDSRAAVVDDSVRLLRANIDFMTQGVGQITAVTSPDPVQGKSTTASLLAITAAKDGERTVLIEGDLRRPGLSDTILGSAGGRGGTGLSDYLAGLAQVDDIIHEQAGRPGLHVIWSGRVPPNPAALLSSSRLPMLLDELRPHFDRIIIDTPPVSVGPDASVTVARAQGTLLVIDARDIGAKKIRAALTQLERSQANILGVVLNYALTRRDLGSYGYDLAYAAAPLQQEAPPPTRV